MQSVARAFVAIGAAVALSSCASGSSAPQPTSTTDYATATCRQWSTELTPEQQTEASVQLLNALRVADGVAPIPADDPAVASFAHTLDAGCSDRFAKVSLAEMGQNGYAMMRGTLGHP